MQVDEYVTRPPTPALRALVAPYSGYRQHGLAPGQHRGLPSTTTSNPAEWSIS